MYAGILIILSSPAHPRTRAFAALVGSVFIVTVIGLLAVEAGSAATDPRQPSNLSGVINLVLGILLLYLAINRFFKKQDSNKERKPRFENSSTRPQFIKYIGLGIVLTVVNPTSLASFLTAAKLTVDSDLGSASELIAMIVAGFYYTLPILLPLALAIIAPALSRRFLEAVDRLLNKYGRYIMTVFLVLIGLKLIQKAMEILT